MPYFRGAQVIYSNFIMLFELKNETNNEIIENIKDDKEIIDDGIFITTDQVGAFCLGAISAIIISALMGGG